MPLPIGAGGIGRLNDFLMLRTHVNQVQSVGTSTASAILW